MALPDEYKIKVVPSDVYSLIVDYIDDTTNDPVNLTGKTVNMVFYSKDSVVFTLTSGSGLTITPLIGRVVVSLTSAQTELLRTKEDRTFVLRDTTSELTILRGRVEAFPVT